MLKVATGSSFDIGQNAVLDTSLKHFKQNYFIGSDDTLGNNDFELKKIDKNSIILRTSLHNALNTLRKMNLNESGLKHIRKQSNLVRYFNA